MLIEDKLLIKAPIQNVWERILDPETLGSTIPGCEKLEVVDENTYDSVVKVKVGFISLKFKFRTVISEIEPLKHFKATGGGEDAGKGGTFNQETVVDLVEISPNEVEVAYKSHVRVVGKLATFGEKIMRVKAKQMGEEFTKNLIAKLTK